MGGCTQCELVTARLAGLAQKRKRRYIAYEWSLTHQYMLCIVAIVLLHLCQPYCVLHKSLLLAVAIGTTNATNLVRPNCHSALWYYFIHLF